MDILAFSHECLCPRFPCFHHFHEMREKVCKQWHLVRHASQTREELGQHRVIMSMSHQPAVALCPYLEAAQSMFGNLIGLHRKSYNSASTQLWHSETHSPSCTCKQAHHAAIALCTLTTHDTRQQSTSPAHRVEHTMLDYQTM